MIKVLKKYGEVELRHRVLMRAFPLQLSIWLFILEIAIVAVLCAMSERCFAEPVRDYSVIAERKILELSDQEHGYVDNLRNAFSVRCNKKMGHKCDQDEIAFFRAKLVLDSEMKDCGCDADKALTYQLRMSSPPISHGKVIRKCSKKDHFQPESPCWFQGSNGTYVADKLGSSSAATFPDWPIIDRQGE